MSLRGVLLVVKALRWLAIGGAVVLGSGLLMPATNSASVPSTRDPLGNAVKRLVTMPGGPSGLVVVIQRGRRRTVLSAGAAELGSSKPPTATQHMRLASVSKAFSGAVALALVQRRRLLLNETIGQLLGWAPRSWRRVTLRELLQHTSGLPDYTASPGFGRLLNRSPHGSIRPRALLRFVFHKPLQFRPGSRYRYNNSDNIAVALMAEAATGRSYGYLLRNLVFRPLGLARTSLPVGWRLPMPYMHGYELVPGRPAEDVSTVVSAAYAWASGGIVSTPSDLNRFIRGYVGRSLFPTAVQRQQFTFVRGSSDPRGPGANEAGVGVFRYRTACGSVYGHTGSIFGYTQFAAATRGGRASVTVSATTQIPNAFGPQVLRALRHVEELAVCRALAGR